MPFEPILQYFRGKSVPIHRHTGWSLFGGLTLFLFIVQAVTGALLSLHYQPAAETAHVSVSHIIGEVPFGWFVRSAHIWSSHLLIVSILAHLTSKYFLRSYRHPHRATWVSGIVLILVFLALAFTGHLLPWEVTGYYATQIGTDIVAATPLIGPILAGVLRGGADSVDGTTLTRIYSLHTVVLPFIAVLAVLWYALAHLTEEPAIPEGTEVSGWMPFYPNAVYRVALASLGGGMALFTLTLWFPFQQGPEASPLAVPPPGIRPEWYFLPVYQAIRVLPGRIGGVATETLITLTILFLLALLLSIQRIDRGRGRMMRFIGAMFLLYAMTSILLSYIVV